MRTNLLRLQEMAPFMNSRALEPGAKAHPKKPVGWRRYAYAPKVERGGVRGNPPQFLLQAAESLDRRFDFEFGDRPVGARRPQPDLYLWRHRPDEETLEQCKPR